MSDLNIERLLIDFYNKGDLDVLAQSSFNSSTPIVENASDYMACVEFASIDLTNLILDINPDYEIMILNDEGDKAGNRFPNLPHYVNTFRFPGALKEVDQLTDWFYNIFHKQTLPESLGTLTLTKDGYFRRILTQDEYDNSYENGLFQVYVNTPLGRLLPEFIDQSDTGSITIKGKVWWKLSSRVGDEIQSRDTLAQLLKATSIRFFSTLPTAPYRIYNQTAQQIIRDDILTTIAINNQTTDIMNKTSKRYEPNVYRHISLVNNQPITDFKIWAMIYYSDGATAMHTLRPGDYMNLQIAFIPNK